MTRNDHMPFPVTAVMCVRNEAAYLHRTLQHLVDHGVRIMVIDHASTDDTARILDAFSAHIIHRMSLPWSGAFELDVVLREKARLFAGITDGWIIHQDADELLESPNPGERLADAIKTVDATPANIINFDEFVFLPVGGLSCAGRDFRDMVRHYYVHEPVPFRLMRAWRADAGLTQEDGGHRLVGASRMIHPRNFVLRHYPFHSQEHARRKYMERRFVGRNIKRGWHFNRINVIPEDMEFPPVSRLKVWAPGAMLDKSDPWQDHFWHTAMIQRTGNARR